MSSLSRTQERRARHRRGILAEFAAMAWLMLKGYRLIAHRYRTPVGEIDLVMRRGRTLVFVEVKARSSIDAAAVALHVKNQGRVARAAQSFLASHPRYAAYQVRFDAVLVTWYKRPHHLANAF